MHRCRTTGYEAVCVYVLIIGTYYFYSKFANVIKKLMGNLTNNHTSEKRVKCGRELASSQEAVHVQACAHLLLDHHAHS